MSNKEIKFTEVDNALRALLSNNPEGLTLAEINASGAFNEVVKPGHISSALKKGYLVKIGDRIVETVTKAPKTVYTFVTADVTMNEKSGKPNTYTENEARLLEIIKTMGGEFICDDLTAAWGSKVPSGVLTSLVKKGNLAKGDEKCLVPGVGKRKVGVYALRAE